MVRLAIRILIGSILLVSAGCAAVPAAETTPTEIPTLPEDTPTADPGTPQVVVNDPPSGFSADQFSPLMIHSTATDEIGISRVDLLVDGVLVRSDATPEGQPQTQYSLLQAWIPDQVGEYVLTVIAFRTDGTPSEQALINVSVVEPAIIPETGGEEAPQECTATALTTLNIREGPDVVYPIRGGLLMGQTARVTGKNASSLWWQIDFNGGPGWISAPHTFSEGSCDDVQEAAAPPQPVGATPIFPTGSPTVTVTGTLLATAAGTLTPTTPGGLTPTWTVTPTRTNTPPAGATPTWTHTPTRTNTPPSGTTPTWTYTPPPGTTPTQTYTPSRTPTTGATPSYTPSATYTVSPPTLTYTPSATYTAAAPTNTQAPAPTATNTSPPTSQVAPPDANLNGTLNIPLDSTASLTDFVSYPGGDTTDRVNWDISGMNPNAALSGGQARLIIAVSCFGTGTQNVQFFTGGQTYSCGQAIVDRDVTYDSRTGSVTITAVGGNNTYVQWVVTGTATRTN